MSLSIIPTAVFLSPEVVKLGQFTVNLAQIHETNYYPDDAESPKSTIADFQYQGHRQDDTQTGFRAVLSSLISANLFRKSDYNIHIAPGHGNNYLLCDVEQWFNTTLDSDGAKRFIQSCAMRSDEIFMVVGMQTLIDPHITIASSTATEAEVQFSVPNDISLAAGVGSPAFQAGLQTAKNQGLEFIVPGERLFALLYRKVKFRWLRRCFNDQPVLDRTTRRWNCLGDTWRSIDDSSGSDDENKSEDSDHESNIGDDAIEVTLGEELEVSDGRWITARSGDRLYFRDVISAIASIDQTANTTRSAKRYVVVPGKPASSSCIMANKSIECALYNSSYAVNFTFDNGRQNITYKSKRLNGVTSTDAGLNQDTGSSQFNAAVAYIALMDSLGKLLLGSLGISHYGVMRATQTQIMSSILMDAKEMQVLGGVNAATDRPEVPDSVIGNISMADALEQLFTNATISLFSNSKLLQNDTAASRGNITYLTTQIAFSYEPRNLFIAYGLGVLASAIIVIIGLLCIKSASASYATTFSTILRTTRNPDIDTIIPAAETSGAEPLSKHLGDTRLVLRRQERKVEGIGENMVTLFAVDSMPHQKGRQKDSPYDSSHPGDRGQQYSDASIELLSHVDHSATDARTGNSGRKLFTRGN